MHVFSSIRNNRARHLYATQFRTRKKRSQFNMHPHPHVTLNASACYFKFKLSVVLTTVPEDGVNLRNVVC